MIGELVARLIAAGTPPEIAAAVVAEAFAAGASCGKSGGIPADETAERRRAYDRDRKRQSAEIRRKSAETPQNSTPPLTLTSSQIETIPSKEGKKVRARATQLSAEWKPNHAHFEAAERLKISRSAVLEKADDMRLWAKSKAVARADWDATFHGFLRRDAKAGQANGKRTVIDAADDLLERVRSFDKPAPSGIRDGAGAADVRMLPKR